MRFVPKRTWGDSNFVGVVQKQGNLPQHLKRGSVQHKEVFDLLIYVAQAEPKFVKNQVQLFCDILGKTLRGVPTSLKPREWLFQRACARYAKLGKKGKETGYRQLRRDVVKQAGVWEVMDEMADEGLHRFLVAPFYANEDNKTVPPPFLFIPPSHSPCPAPVGRRRDKPEEAC